MTRLLMLIALALPLLAAGISCGEARSQEGSDDIIIFHNRDRGGYLGVSVQDLSEVTDSVKTSAKEGAVVKEVLSGGPAGKAGLKKNDVIVEFNGKKIEDRWDLLREVRSLDPGTSAKLVVVRGDRRETLTATLDEAPAERRMHAVVPDIPVAPRAPWMLTGSTYGLSLMELNDQLAEFFEAPNRHGVLVEEVEEKSPAAEAGFKAGDVIIRIGKETVEDIGDVWSALDDYKQGEKADVEVIRRGGHQSLALTIAGDDDQGRFRGRRHRMFWRGDRFDWDSKAFEKSMKEFSERMKVFGKELEEKMKGVEKRIHDELEVIKM